MTPARVIARVLHLWYLKGKAFPLSHFCNCFSTLQVFGLLDVPLKMFSMSRLIFFIFLVGFEFGGVVFFVCLVLVYFFNLFPCSFSYLQRLTVAPSCFQVLNSTLIKFEDGWENIFFLLFLLCCRFWLELLLALEQVYRLHPVCPDLHWCDWLHHLPLAWLISLCGNAGLPRGVHRGDVRCSAALPKLPEQVDRRNEVWCSSYIKQV